MEYSNNGTDDYDALATLYKALAHPARLRILDVVARREACVCHLTALLGMRQPYVSQQLATLREAGVVVGRREGTLMYYRLVDTRLAGLLSLGHALAGTPRAAIERLSADVDGPLSGCHCPSCQDGSTCPDHPESAPAHSRTAG